MNIIQEVNDKFQEIEDEEMKKKDMQFIELSELMQKKFPDTQWLVENLIPKNGITAISGSPASFKTWIILEIANKISAGIKLFNQYETQKCGVLIIDEENGERLLQTRFNMINVDIYSNVHLSSLNNFKVQNDVDEVIDFCHSKNIELIIIDSLIRIHSNDENDAMKMAKVFTQLKKFNKTGLTVIFTHHNRKKSFFQKKNSAEDMRGSSDILAALDTHIAIARENEFISVYQTKSRYSNEIMPFKVEIIKSDEKIELSYHSQIDETQTKKEEAKKIIIEILKHENREMYTKELIEMVKQGNQIGEKSIADALNEMSDKGDLNIRKGEQNKKYYYLPDMEVDTENEIQTHLL